MEDHADSLDALTMFLTSLGHRVWAAPDADRAFHILHQTRVHVLLTDVLMPGVSGWDLMRNLRASGHLPPFVISMSAMHQWEVLPLSREAGCHAHLVKPIIQVQLVQALEKASTLIH